MEEPETTEDKSARRTLDTVYRREKPRFVARLRAAGRTVEEAEDLVHDAYAALAGRLWLIPRLRNPTGWIAAHLKRRLIDLWRHDRVRESSGETSVAAETLQEIIAGAGLDPLDSLIREGMVDALDTAIKALPLEQRTVIEAQVFGGRTFREIAESTGESIDALTARKRYAMRKLSAALKHWLDD